MATLPTGTLTLFFTDVEGSTRLQQEVGERYDGYLAEHHRIVRDALDRHSGTEVDTQGEAFFATFPRATDAAAAAADVQRALGDHPFSVRIGLHTGQPRLAETGYVGLDVPRAARICSAAHGGQVLLSQATRELLGDSFATKDLGEHRLKDLIEPVRLFQLAADGLGSTFPPPRTLETRPTNLPVQQTVLVGRTREVEAVSDLLLRDDVRLVTLTGAGGTGKTRIGLQVAAETLDAFEDGVFFVPLEAVTDPTLLLAAIAQSLGIAHGAGHQDAVAEFLSRRSLLLVVDNFEHLSESAPMLTRLLDAPRLRLLVTSREPLRLSAEHEYPVPPLGVPDLARLPELAALSQYESVALFVERAQAARPDFAVTTENAPAIAEICVRLDGLPLAIELAAARVRILSPQAMLARLGRRLELLTGGSRDLPSRQRTLRGAIDWSYELLDEPGRHVLARLSVFAGGCTLEAAEHVAGAGLDDLEALIDKSLLRQEEGLGGEPRFSMLETIREYAQERLAELPEADETRRRHLDWTLGWFEDRTRGRMETGEVRGNFEPEEQEHENAQVALAYAREADAAEEELRLATAARFLWVTRGLFEHGRERVGDALARAPGVPAAVRGWALVALAHLSWPQGDWDGTYENAQEARAVFASLGDELGQAAAANALALALDGLGRTDESRPLYDEAEEYYRRAGALYGLAIVLNNRSYALITEGRLDRAEALLREALPLTPDEGTVMLNLGLIRYLNGDLDEAARLYGEALRVAIALGNPEMTFYAVEGLACVASGRGADELAARLWGASETMRERINAPLQHTELEVHDRCVARTRERLGAEATNAAWAVGRTMPAQDAVAEALELAG